MIRNHHDINTQQYQGKANAYLTSAVHAQGIEFAKMRDLLTQHGLANVLDLGCGGGHVSYQVAKVVTTVTAYDLSAEMVATVLATAQQQGLTNIQGQVGSAEQLPFGDGQFDAVISRYSAHHWQNITQALQEIYRVLSPNGYAIIVDIIGNSHPLLNNFLQTIETIRDPSHVRNYNLSEWTAMVEMIGFRVEKIEKQCLTLDFDSWVQRMKTPNDSIHVIHALQQQASDMVKAYFDIQANGSFTSDVMYLVLSK